LPLRFVYFSPLHDQFTRISLWGQQLSVCSPRTNLIITTQSCSFLVGLFSTRIFPYKYKYKYNFFLGHECKERGNVHRKAAGRQNRDLSFTQCEHAIRIYSNIMKLCVSVPIGCIVFHCQSYNMFDFLWRWNQCGYNRFLHKFVQGLPYGALFCPMKLMYSDHAIHTWNLFCFFISIKYKWMTLLRGLPQWHF